MNVSDLQKISMVLRINNYIYQKSKIINPLIIFFYFMIYRIETINYQYEEQGTASLSTTPRRLLLNDLQKKYLWEIFL